MAKQYKHVPNAEVESLDGRLAIQQSETGKRVLILGTASKGPGLEPYRVRNAATMRALFGSSGSLLRGYYQCLASGYNNIWVMRMGAKGAAVEGIGDENPFSIYTVQEDADVNDYTVYYHYDGSTGPTLKVWDGDPSLSTTNLIYSLVDGTEELELGLIEVSGDAVDGPDIGTLTVPISISDLYTDYIGANTYELTYVELGTDGVVTNPTKCQLYEYLYDVYELLIGWRFERVVPMDVYADDYSIAFIKPGDTVDGITIGGGETILPTSLRSSVLGWLNVYKDEYGVNHFDWAWDLVKDEASVDGHDWASMDERSSATLADTNKDYAVRNGINGPVGCPAESGGYHEVDFAYQLGNFCWDQSANDHECSGVIGVNPPPSFAMRAIYRWIGKLPTYSDTTTEDDAPYRDITANGYGLCGLPYTVGCLQSSRNILARLTTTSTFYPGYFGTDTGFPDGATVTDEGEHVIDLGAFFDIFGGWMRYNISWDRSSLGYSGSGAAWYAGFQLLRPSYEAPTNKLVTKSITYPYNASKGQLNDLGVARIVHLQRKDRGIVVCSAHSAAMLDSDYVRRSCKACVQDVVTSVRQASDIFLGNGFGDEEKSALDTAISAALERHKPKYIKWYNFAVTPGVVMGTLGSLRIDLHIVVVNEIGKIHIVIGLQREQS